MLDTIPGPLRDRMEIISLAGYTASEKFQIAFVVGIFVFIVLHDENANGGGGRAKRHTKPSGRRSTDQLDFTVCGELIENRLRDEHRPPGSIDVRRTTSPNLLGGWRLVKLIREERKVEHAGRRLIECNEAIFRVQHLLQRLMNHMKQVVQIVGGVYGVDNFKRHLPLEFRALARGDINWYSKVWTKPSSAMRRLNSARAAGSA